MLPMVKYEGYFHEVIKVWNFGAQQITTKTDIRCLEKPGPEHDIHTIFMIFLDSSWKFR